MDKDLIIESERLILRGWKLEDADDVVEGLNNINVAKWMSHTPFPYTKDDAIKFITNSIENKLYNFAIVLKEENKVIGGTQLRNIDLVQGTAGGGIWLNENYQGKGYGSEAWGARIKYAFEVLGLRRLENGFFAGNERSWNMQKKFGYKIEGIRRGKYIPLSTGVITDEYITGLLKEDWMDNKEKTNVVLEPLFEEYVDFDTFSKSDFRVVRIKECSAVEKSKKLLKFILDDGTGTDRIILSGIHIFYEPEELVGKNVVAILNLPPRNMMGIDSCGMLMSAVWEENGEEKLHLMIVDDTIPAGAKLY